MSPATIRLQPQETPVTPEPGETRINGGWCFELPVRAGSLRSQSEMVHVCIPDHFLKNFWGR